MDVLFWNKWRKKTKRNWLTQVHLETVVKIKVVMVTVLYLSRVA